MDSLIILAGIGSDLSQAARETALTFGLNWPHFIAQVISFCLVAYILHRWAYKPVLLMLDERKERIAEGLANAEKIKAELARTEVDRQKVLDQANLKADQMIADARAAAARIQEAEIQKAIATAEQIVTKAREATVLDQARMLAELKREVGRLVVETTAKVAGKVLTLEDQQRLMAEAAKQLAA